MHGLTKELKDHVDGVVLRATERFRGPANLVKNLESLIHEATDKGLASAVFWHGKWWNYNESKVMLNYLLTVAASQAPQQIMQVQDVTLNQCA